MSRRGLAGLPSGRAAGNSIWCIPYGSASNLPEDQLNTLSDTEVQTFIQDGFVRVDDAFPRKLAHDCRAIMWRDLDCDPDDPATWTRPVIKLGGYRQAPFARAANTPRLHSAFDQLVGKGRWLPRMSLGSFLVRFPSPDEPHDTGWHIDVSFPAEDSKPDDYSTWYVNIRSRGRALLLLFLFSDVGEQDAPTRIRIGSHMDMAPILEPFGEVGVSSKDLESMGLDDVSANRPEALAIGTAGTVYLCHPFLVHTAQLHRGSTPRFLAQPELTPAEPFMLHRKDENYSPVEVAIRRGLRLE